ncbi:MAG: hypothetical protein HKN23_13520 [Verrucomicrobiales bacterium]|nr:hypothetical protein [Verrucomicrobiales bacterium]
MPPELSEKLLADAGGWKEWKEARTIHKAGAVLEAAYDKNGLLEGLVKVGGRPTKVRLKIQSATDMENFCPCPRARREGIICGHALAIGLEILQPTKAQNQEVDGESAKPAPLSPDWPKFVDAATETAVPAELFVVFPPNFAGMWQNGRLMAGIEIQVAEEDRKMLAAEKSKDREFFVDARDLALIRALQVITPETVPGMMQFGRADFLTLLENLAGHPRVTFGKKDPARIGFQPYRPRLELDDRVTVSWPDAVIPLSDEAKKTAWAFSRTESLFQPVSATLPENGLPFAALTASDFARLRGSFEVNEADLPEILSPEVALEIEGSLNHLDAKFSFDYESTGRFLRDEIAERSAKERLTEWGFEPVGKSETDLVLKDKSAILRFFAHGFPRLPDDWKITTGERFDHAEKQVEPIQPGFDFEPSSGENWFSMAVEFATPSGDSISSAQIRHLLRMGQNSQKTADGKIAVLDESLAEELENVIADCDPDQSGGRFQIGAEHAGYLRETAADSGIAISGKPPWKVEPDTDATAEIAADLADVLRPYQSAGVEWMRGLAARSMGGILADDMGLGKTLQALTFIQCAGRKSLVVCPSSLVFNWIAEAEKFVPDLKVVALTGPDRAEKFDADADLFVTSYAILRLDADKFRGREFTTVILDEAQHIKNPDAKVSKAAHRLHGKFRFALTGTPIENSVKDLWSILQFAMPGYLGERRAFLDRFAHTAAQKRLARKIRPVILRRLKTEVAADLPEKIEQVVYCDLKPKQQEVYEKLLRESRETILDAEGGRKRMLALTALLRLRQTCCDLRLLGLPDIENDVASVKLDALEELLEEAVEGGHRVLVFSQFVQMLQVLVPFLSERGLDFCYLDGSTRNRGEVVAKFQSSESIPVFLISLKAGGVGLNLTAADTVIHIDPWWNPAVEAQATDRAHRIGQERVVTSYKLITRNTVEEKILALQEKKRKTIQSLLDSPEADLGESGLSEDELLGLFE